ncbi:MAG: 30S ribosome-binding factor RbfA [Candidatus Nanopelagicales bacterium]|nr:30S ribosome-binding factor RbfA [Candidatus Nanopelagicales bacterium]
MNTPSPRSRRLAERIHVVIAEMLERRVKDPRLGFVTVTSVRVTNDLRDATVYYTVLGDDQQCADSAVALESAKGLMRSEVGRQTGVKFTPTLSFVADTVPSSARRIDDLLRQAREADERVQHQAAQAAFAGDTSPYRDGETTTSAEKDDDHESEIG